MAWAVGDKVQVLNTGSWSEAEVITAPLTSTVGVIYEVKYISTSSAPALLSGRPTGWYRDSEIRSSLQAPATTPVSAAAPIAYSIGDKVDVLENGIWAKGVISDKDSNFFGVLYQVNGFWYEPKRIRFPTNTAFVAAPVKRAIPLYPHKCPQCGSPAYTGCVPAALDCSMGCHNKR